MLWMENLGTKERRKQQPGFWGADQILGLLGKNSLSFFLISGQLLS